ncbi:WhiB family transcriptional regulator [Ornithinimicrobium ciconiae]|uniref:WhiB family transcriptional regulator n=1 Tax=Ornithinimicrobium ciconiae TaxID=2594265 RepID=UPI002AA29D9B|nr:WhiB family transcriptional regulator [Ornithinimicrobium ciconiae]
MPTSHPGSIGLLQAAREVTDLACRREPELYFADRPEPIERAKALCAECPIRELCLQAALEAAEPWGVWGGELIERGRILPHKRPRGRPRKNPAAA